MLRLREACGIFCVVLACAPHERPQAPSRACPTGMVEVGGDAGGTLAVGRVCMDITEVTTAAYGACVQAGVCTPAIFGDGTGCNLTRADRGDHPINCAGWDQAQTFCGWLGKRMPDDEEWLWAAQGGALATAYPWGHTPPDGARACWARKDQGTCAVGSVPGGASPAGVVDLIGNAAEWTRGSGGDDVRGERGRLRGGSYVDSVYVRPIDERIADSARDEASEAATPTSGIRCVVSPHTPVQDIEDLSWTPYVHHGLPPVLAVGAAPTVPVRPLANLAVLYHSAAVGDVWWPLGDGAIATPPAVGAALGFEDPLQLGAAPQAIREFVPLRWLGDADTVLMRGGSAYDLKLIAVEPATFKLRWQAGLGGHGRTFEQVITPRVLVASFPGDADTVVAYALDSGREVWRIGGIGEGKDALHVQKMWADGERLYLLGNHGLMVLDANTSKPLWAAVAVAAGCGVVSDAEVVIVEDPAGYRVLHAGTGHEVLRFGAPGACGWSASTWEEGVPPGVLVGGRLVAFVPQRRQGDADTATLVAYDVATGKELWRRPRTGRQRLVADRDAVFVARGEEVLQALDMGTGEMRAELSVGSRFDVSVRPGGGEAGPLVVVDGDDTGQWILGRGAAPVVPETYVVRGRLVPLGIVRGRVANVPVRVGGRLVHTDAGGRFEARGSAVGAVSVRLATDRGPDGRGGSRLTFEASMVVLGGSGKYDTGDIELTDWSLY